MCPDHPWLELRRRGPVTGRPMRGAGSATRRAPLRPVLTMMLSWTKPFRCRAGFRCGYSSVLVTWTPQTLRQAAYSGRWTG